MFAPRIALLAVAGAAAPAPTLAQIAAFRYRPDASPVGQVFVYDKSNLDGSQASQVAVYVASPDRLESFKWHPGASTGTLVAADLDWSRFSVRRFESWRVRSGERTSVATLEALPDGRYHFALGTVRDTVRIDQAPWHSYDFDLASLGATFPHLVEPGRPFSVGIADATESAGGFTFRAKGPVTIAFLNEESWAGRPARRYRIDGPGLEHRGGHLWVAHPAGYLLGYEIDLPDEPDMTSGRLALARVERMTPDEWAAFQRRSLAPR